MINFFNSEKIKSYITFAKKYERHIGIAALFGGFIFDALTLGEPGGIAGNVILGSYLLVSMGCIMLLSVYRHAERGTPSLLLFLLQFCFGNVAGGLTFLYGQSGTLEGSALFFIVFGIFILANEFLREKYMLLRFHIGAWFFLLLAYASLVIPGVLKRIGDEVFLGGVFFSLALALLLLLALYIVSPKAFDGVKRQIIAIVGGVALVFVGLYFSNVIPPVPLSMEQMGIFHSMTRTDGRYEGVFEKPAWYDWFHLTNNIFSYVPKEGAYCFSSVRAPQGLGTRIYHRWEFFNESKDAWVTVNRFPFFITGGRSEGYRGYTQKFALTEGRWRCSVETESGALVGRTTFTIVERQPQSVSRIVF